MRPALHPDPLLTYPTPSSYTLRPPRMDMYPSIPDTLLIRLATSSYRHTPYPPSPLHPHMPYRTLSHACSPYSLHWSPVVGRTPAYHAYAIPLRGLPRCRHVPL